MEIIIAPNIILSQTAKEVGKVDSSVLKTVSKMKKALDLAHDPIGVGLAAPQIGKPLRIFIARPNPKSKMLVFINPMTEKSEPPKSHFPTRASHISRRTSKLEGCLSLPDIWGVVQRPREITVSFLDEQGKKHTKKFKGLLSIVVQHEIDHLDGILFTKKVLEQKEKLYRSHKNKKGEDIFEPISLI